MVSKVLFLIKTYSLFFKFICGSFVLKQKNEKFKTLNLNAKN